MKINSIKDIFIIQSFGNSMYPFFHDGDIITIKKIPIKNICVNDFITFKHKNTFITHRVIYIPPHNKGWIYTKGDNNLKKDSKVFTKDVLGKVTEIKRNKTIINPTQLYFFQSSVYFDELKKVSTLLFKSNINFIFLKGLPINLYYEKDYPKRIYADCDLLIDKKDFKKSIHLLQKLDYHEDKSGKAENEVSFYKRINNIRVILDLHKDAVFMSMHSLGESNLLYPKKLLNRFTKDCLEQKKIISVRGYKFPVLSLPYLITYLLLHLFHHHYKGYYRYRILTTILSKKDLPYKEIESIIRKYKINGYVYPVFLLLKKYYDVRITKKFLNMIQPNKITVKYIKRNLINLDIFNDDIKSEEGVKKFKSVLSLSPQKMWIKFLIFLKPKVIKLVVWVYILRLRRFMFFNNFIPF